MEGILDELLKKLDELQELTKDFSMFKHLFSDDKGEETLAKIRQTAGKIKWQVKASTLKEIGHPEGKPIKEIRETGSFVKVRPCGDWAKDKTYLGIYIGDAALSSSISIEDDKITCNWALYNPAILLPEVGKIVYGIESWWGRIKSEEDLKEISDLDIENVWYVKALKQIHENNDKEISKD